MMTDKMLDAAGQSQRVKDFFLARQPILDRKQGLVAYELLFRSAAIDSANVTDDLAATASVIAHAAELGLENVIGDSLGFVNVDAAVLMSDFVNFLPPDKIILEILETVTVTPALIQRVAKLTEAGFSFALDDVVANSVDVQKLLPLVNTIKIDVMDMDSATLARLANHFMQAGKTLLAEKVETVERFQECLDLGFHYFQGYYFARPGILSGKKLSPSQLTIMQLMALIITDAETREIEACIKQDVSLGLTLLRLANTPAFGLSQRIDSLGQALILLGRRQLQRWLQILLYTDRGKGRGFMSPLLILATTRGKLLELIAEKIYPGQRNVADIAFTVGIMSLMDTLFDSSMEKILEQISVADSVSDALLQRNGLYGDMLKLVEYIERIEEAGPLLVPMLHKLRLSTEDLYQLELAAFEWSDTISRAAG
ncbi:MAG TPA: EAL domain-containing protein [Burkholderiaceae bacterium]|nr:EAL domain-containing protein [Burkholderiaceae bacterium]